MAKSFRKLPAFQIKVAALPGSVFFSYDSLVGNAERAFAEQDALDAFRGDGDRDSLHFALGECGWDYDSIEAIVANPSSDHLSCLYDIPLAA